jgi:hypothetical protein
MPQTVTANEMSRRFAGETRNYWMQEEFRRAAAWAVGAGIVLPWIALAIDWWQGFPHSQDRLVFLIGVGWAVSAWLSQALVPVVRIDSRGIAYRAFWVWHLWEWEIFSTPGRVIPVSGGTGYFQKSRWPGANRLSLGLLPDSDIDEIDSLIRSVLHSPDECPPESLSVQIPWLTLEVNPAGLRYRHQRTDGECAWTDVCRVKIWRSAHGRRNFRQLTIELADRQLEVRGIDGYAKRVALSEFLIHHMEADRVQEFALSGPARSLAEIDARIERLRKLEDEQSSVNRFAGRFLMAVGVVAFVFMHWLKVLVMVALFSPMFVVGFIFLRHERRKDEAEMAALERERVDFSSSLQA